MSNSKLATVKSLSPYKTEGRDGKSIKLITIHCFVGQVTVERGLQSFMHRDPGKEASCNYVVGCEGKIGLCVEEKNRSWCTGGTKTVNGITGSMNDYEAITIEVACDAFHPYKITDAAMKALIELCTDICERNNIKELKWKADPTLVGKPDKQNMTAHRWFAYKACPGDYLYSKFGYIASEVNLRLKANKLNATCTYAVETTVAGVKAYDKLGGKVVRKFAKGAKLNVASVHVYNGELYGRGKKTKQYFRLKNTQIPAPKPVTKKLSVAEVAKEVIAGKWGNGDDRKKKLKAAGYDPDAVQKEVNKLLKK